MGPPYPRRAREGGHVIQPDVFDLLAEQEAPSPRAACEHCGRFHSAADTTVAGSRFVRPPAYRGTYPGAPSRPTRQAAQQDMCHHRATTTRGTDS